MTRDLTGRTGAAGSAGGVGVRRPWLLLVLMCSTQALNVANISSVNIALPDIAADRGRAGIGAAAGIPAALGILTSTFTAPVERSRAVAAFGAAGAVGFASGLILGGLVTGPLGRRWVFGLTVPPAAALLATTCSE